MTCKAGVECETFKDSYPKIGEIQKTGPRWLKGGILYKGCTLLKLGEDRETYEPITLEDIQSEDVGSIVKGATGTCDIDLRNTPEDQACSVGILLRACMIADYVCWPEGYTQKDIDLLVACSNCCLTFEWIANWCPIAQDFSAGDEKKVPTLPTNTESEVVKAVASKDGTDDDPAKAAILAEAETKNAELDQKAATATPAKASTKTTKPKK